MQHGRNPLGLHHGVNEVWSNDFAKWVLLDGEYDFHFERDGQVLSALETHEAVRRNGGRGIVKVQGPERAVVPMKGLGFPFTSAVGYWWVSYHVQQNTFTQPNTKEFRLVVFDNDAFRQTTWYRQGGDNTLRKHWAYDAKALVPTRKRHEIEWTPGANLRPSDRPAGDGRSHRQRHAEPQTTQVRAQCRRL